MAALRSPVRAQRSAEAMRAITARSLHVLIREEPRVFRDIRPPPLRWPPGWRLCQPDRRQGPTRTDRTASVRGRR
ncbi:protein of unknown function [Modestobacter italicus]|uniref:Uncharacterized protein n=1 Tax=Modestobacter italicus (strain DSM 44449 / CECT 9708 / BC 501) TaxID=2732864 RepID=I4F0C6_MODI5|nr:protein of unknown function [Modestobacter marinus]